MKSGTLPYTNIFKKLNIMNNEKRDELLWQMAKRRASFKWSLATYVFVNAFLVAIWYFTSYGHVYFWPMWPMLGWGIGLAFQYFNAYHGDRIFSAEEEYEKLRRQHL